MTQLPGASLVSWKVSEALLRGRWWEAQVNVKVRLSRKVRRLLLLLSVDWRTDFVLASCEPSVGFCVVLGMLGMKVVK